MFDKNGDGIVTREEAGAGNATPAVGTAPVGTVSANAGAACAQYRYDANQKDAGGNFVAPSDTI